MKVRIDRSACIGCSVCWTDSPEIFEQDPEDGLSRIVAEFRRGGDPGVGEVPESLRPKAQSAADNCPVSVISVE